MADAWDYGPGDASSASLSFAEMLSGGSKALAAIVNASNDVSKALGSSSATSNSRQDDAAKKATIPTWMWVLGAVAVWKMTR